MEFLLKAGTRTSTKRCKSLQDLEEEIGTNPEDVAQQTSTPMESKLCFNISQPDRNTLCKLPPLLHATDVKENAVALRAGHCALDLATFEGDCCTLHPPPKPSACKTGAFWPASKELGSSPSVTLAKIMMMMMMMMMMVVMMMMMMMNSYHYYYYYLLSLLILFLLFSSL